MDASSSRVIVVTGASRGIGKAVAVSLASSSALIYVNYVSRLADAENAVKEIEAKGGKAKPIQFDIANASQTEKAFDQIASDAGGIDVLIANAGISIDSLLLRVKNEDIDKLVDTNLKGAMAVTREALKTMLRRKNSGRIVYLSSVVGQMGNAGQSVYAATKAGMIGFMKSVAREVASRGITVNAVAPGLVKTDMTEALTDAQKNEMLKRIPLARWAEPDDIANVVRFLVSEKASYITGQVIAVNGGMYL